MKTLTFLFFLLFSTFALAQDTGLDVIYLNDGSVLKGKIIERLDDGAIKMQMSSGREIIVSMKEIKQVTIDGIGTNTTDYGGKTALGIAILGESAFGVNFRIRAADELFFNIGISPSAKLAVNQFNDDVELDARMIYGGGVEYYLTRKYKEKKQKIRAQGLFFRTAHAFGRFEQTWVSAGWSSEFFRLNRFKRGFVLNLGLGLVANHWVDDPINAAYNENVLAIQPNTFIRLQWNFFQ